MNELDWTLLDEPAVRRAIGAAVSSAGRSFEGITELDDLRQEAAILVASNATKVRGYLEDTTNPGYLSKWLWSRLVDLMRPHARKANSTIPIQRLEAVRL
ncbi:hypothetical protein JNUCC0626_40005 [Lentzea sp. JNUCC 0626]|uniref:hypothetical protein n=1 Tax=Lentzea sp. JNUCC 0626 TaxID=3367513 RepID=UPI003747BD07